MNQLFSRLNLAIIFTAIAGVYIFGMFIDIMDIDAAQYASLSREMFDSKSFLIVKYRLEDYLDKPPLTFWLASLSYWIFGISNFSYKLPSVLFSILSIYSTYRFAKIYYSNHVAILSALILATTQAFFLINNDCRTDTILIGCIAFTSWHLASYFKTISWVNFILAFFGIGLAMLSKGPLGLMVPVLGFGLDLLLRRDFKSIFQWQWILGLIIIAVLLLPMCVGLYQQFGLKGLQFYFWDQSFGRVTGSNSAWQNNPDPFFLMHSFAWSFLPWPILFFTALFFKIRTLWIQKFQIIGNQEFITFSSIIFSYLILSKSQYQLPHYIYGIFPFAAVFTSAFLLEFVSSNTNWAKGFFIAQIIVSLILWIVCGTLIFGAFEPNNFYLFLFGLALGIFIAFIFRKGYGHIEKIILISSITAIGINFFMNTQIYPSLLKYQPSSEIAAYLKSKNVTDKNIFIFNCSFSYSLDFYTKSVNKQTDNPDYFDSLANDQTYYCYTNKEGLEKMNAKGISYNLEKTYAEYPVTKLTLPFLNPKTREEKLTIKYLISFQK